MTPSEYKKLSAEFFSNISIEELTRMIESVGGEVENIEAKKDNPMLSLPNDQIQADLRGALSPFWNLVELMLLEPEHLPEDEEKYAQLLEDEAKRCKALQPKIINLIDAIKH